MKKIIVPTALVSGLLFSGAGQQAMAASGQDVVSQALNYQGKAYQYAAPAFSEDSFDCSSFTQFIYNKVLNRSLPRTSSAQSEQGIAVSKDQLQSGDLLFFDTAGDGGIHHVGIYIGNGKMISAEVTVGVHITNVFSGGGSQSYWEPKFKTARRVVAAPETETAKHQTEQPAQSTAPAQTGTTSSYTVKSGDSLWKIASHHGMTVANLKALNHLKSDLIYPGQVLKLSGSTQTEAASQNSGAAQETEAPAKTSAASYTVKSGDSLWKIATGNGISVSTLKSINGLNADVIFPGQTLKLSGSASSSKTVITQTAAKSTSSSSKSTYKVKSGDSLWEIATLHGISVNQLMRANNLSATLIYPGQHLLIPGSM
ncbi:LysM peptidoglycan-binding domain-containing protein [Sporolactobacillus terrae]|uniref:LysM peptidoglycan-binding domain-containing protein n=1 Tax=Sporolactobacillus terrae TaxID=269673 RepID=UPI00111BAAE3|nr:LysM peptidoglycan-binding domain-containing protein [Sporolactobacillus terrae]